MTTKEFIASAIAGGYKGIKYEFGILFEQEKIKTKWHSIDIERLLLDPEAWKAVGKANGWGENDWKTYMSLLPGDLIVGMTLEESIATLKR